MKKYVSGEEERIVKTMQGIGKEMEKRICEQMERMTEYIKQIIKEWKKERSERDKERRRNKEE